MKRKLPLLLTILLLTLTTLQAQELELTKITGRATTSELGFTINITDGPPSLLITQPKNETYLTTTIPINYTVANSNNEYYNINGGTNTTITGSTSTTLSEGTYNITITANNSYGQSNEIQHFTVNTTRVYIHYNEYAGATKGSSTNFNNTETYEDLGRLENVILENTNYGKIAYTTTVNLLEGITGNTIDLDNNTEIEQYIITVNDNELPGLNTSANISFYNIGFSDPQILIGGLICPQSTCQELSYNAGTYTFSVGDFNAAYTIRETPEEPEPTPGDGDSGSGGGSGGSGGGTTDFEIEYPRDVPIGYFEVGEEDISVNLRQGQTTTKEIEITNPGKNTIQVDIINYFKEFITVEEESFTLQPGITKKVPIHIHIPKSQNPDQYIGLLIIRTKTVEKEVPVAIGVNPENKYFDIEMELLNKKARIEKGETIKLNLDITVIGEEENINTKIEYVIRNEQGKIVGYQTEYRTIPQRIVFDKTLTLLEGLPKGKYNIYIKTSSEQGSESTNQWVNYEGTSNINDYIALGTITTLLIILLWLAIRNWTELQLVFKRKKKQEQ